MKVGICLCGHTYTHAHKCVLEHMHIHMHVRACVHTHISTHTYTHTCMHACKCPNVNAYAYMYPCMHSSTHTKKTPHVLVIVHKNMRTSWLSKQLCCLWAVCYGCLYFTWMCVGGCVWGRGEGRSVCLCVFVFLYLQFVRLTAPSLFPPSPILFVIPI